MQAIFLDIETTGLDCTRHCPIDVAFEVIDMTTCQRKVQYQSLVKQPVSAWELADPASLLINGYSIEMTNSGKEPFVIGKEVIELFTSLGIERGKSVFICQNPAFDRGFFMQLVDVYTQEKLHWPYHWLDFASMYWALLIQQTKECHSQFPEKLNLSKNEIAKIYHLPEEGTPHRAMQGVEHLIACYQAVFGLQFYA